MPASLDALAGGGLLALLERTRSVWLRWAGPVGWLALLAWAAAFAFGHKFAWWAQSVQVPLFVAAVHFASRGLPGWSGGLLASRPAVYLGRISYGIYLYHLPVYLLLVKLAPATPVSSRGWLLFAVGTAVSVITAALSWHLLEAPCNRLKRRFPFPHRAPAKPPLPLASPPTVH